MIDKELEYLNREIEFKKQQMVDSLAEGNAKDYADYKYTVGVIRGLLSVQSYIKTLAHNMEQDDE